MLSRSDTKKLSKGYRKKHDYNDISPISVDTVDTVDKGHYQPENV